MKNETFNCARILFLIALCAAGICAQSKEPSPALKWRDLSELTVEGKGWTETLRVFDRLPAKAEKMVRPEVWRLSRHSAGMAARFVTDAEAIHVRWKLLSANLALPNMTATAVSGVDLYVREAGEWRWAAVGKADKFPVNEQKIIENMSRRKREYLLYLPLYNGTEAVEIGLPADADFFAAAPYPKSVLPIVVYGTSIVQGASASRAGMTYPAILGRKFERPVVNLGFSGNGRMENELAELLSELDAAVYIIDCLPNLASGAEVAERTPRLIETMRRKRPRTPILLIENIKYPDVFIENRKNRLYREKNAALRRVFRDLRASGVGGIFYLGGENLLGSDSEATIDGVHPNDLGFARMAGVVEDFLRKSVFGKQRPGGRL